MVFALSTFAFVVGAGRRFGAARRHLPEDEAEVARLQHADEQARVKAAELADQEVSAGRPIVVLAWQVQVTCYAHRLVAARAG